MRDRIVRIVGAVALACAVALATQGVAQVKKGKSRPMTTKQLMGGLVGPATKDLGKDLQGTGPADDKAWEAAGIKAALLNESGHLMMEDGRCPDATWAAACKTMQDGSEQLLTKIEAKDASGARDAFMVVTSSCKSCHTVFKK
jgi:cytochrome c556